jgi:spermidine/putrescine transport system substrate-binding protein
MTERDPGLLARDVSRRVFLQGTALAGFSAFLAACAGPTQTAGPTGGGATSGPPATGGTGATTAPGSAAPVEVTGPLNFANWDAYIDLTTDPGPDGEEGTDDDEYVLPSPTLEDFQTEYGIEVNYANAEIEDNATFMATIQPQLQSGVSTGWDIIVLTDWMAAKVVEAGWAEQIDPANVPDVLANIKDEYKGLPWDPDLKFHVPWQSGATGVGYNSESTGRALTKIADLFDPAFAGKVTLLSETRDTLPLIHLALQAQGQASQNPPEEMTVADVQAVHDYLKPFVDDGHIKDFTGNEYLSDFGAGSTWAAIVWSGDLASSGGENDVFVYPEEGSMIWTDNMLIPKGAEHKRAAEAMMDFVYDIERAARLANFIYYISPVKGVETAILELDPELEGNELLFPPAEVVAKQHTQPNWNEADEKQVNDLFADLTGT